MANLGPTGPKWAPCWPHELCYLGTQRGWDKFTAISQTTFSITFSWTKMYELRLIYYWKLFLRLELPIFQHWFRRLLGTEQATDHYLNQWWFSLLKHICVTRPRRFRVNNLAAWVLLYGAIPMNQYFNIPQLQVTAFQQVYQDFIFTRNKPIVNDYRRAVQHNLQIDYIIT